MFFNQTARSLGLPPHLEPIDQYLERKPQKLAAEPGAAAKKAAVGQGRGRPRGRKGNTLSAIARQELDTEEKGLCADLKISEGDFAELRERFASGACASRAMAAEIAASCRLSPEAAGVIYDFLSAHGYFATLGASSSLASASHAESATYNNFIEM